MAGPDGGEFLPPCRFVDHDRVLAALTYDRAMALGRTAEARGLLKNAGVTAAALVPEGDHDLARLLAPPHTVRVIWIIESDDLIAFLSDPAQNGVLRHGVALLAMFADYKDYMRLQSMVAALPLLDGEEVNLDQVDKARDDHADDAEEVGWDEDREPDYDDASTWDRGE